MSTRTLVSLSLAIGAGVLFTACGKTEEPAAVAQAEDGVRVVAITANDQMQFSITEIRAEPGEMLRISLTNVGRMPKQAMAHNWVLLKPASDSEVMAWGMSAANNPPDYLPGDSSAVLAKTRMLGPGEKDEIEITVPDTPDEYPFLCTFPGHVALMKGKLVVN